jgi:hypothetical protein
VIVRSWNLRPRPGRYDDAIGLIAEGIKLADRHGANTIRVTKAAMAGPSTGLLVLTCEFNNLTAYGSYLDEVTRDPESESYNHRIREAEAPFIYESTAMLMEIDLGRPDAKQGRGRVLDARFGRPVPGRWDDALGFVRDAFNLFDQHGAVGCRLFELDHAGPQSGLLCGVVEFESLASYGRVADAWLADAGAQRLMEAMRGDTAIQPVTSGLFTEVDAT